MRVLMVCLGNICRSPIAEGVLKSKLQQSGLSWSVDSAGIESYHIGSAPHRYSQAICSENGIDISEQRARQFRVQDLENYDIIYALADDVLDEIRGVCYGQDTANVKLLLDELEDSKGQSVPDPYYGGADGYIFVYELIDRACDAIINKYK